MDSLRGVLVELMSAVVAAGVPALLAYLIPMIRVNVHNARLARLAEGAANAAGRVVLGAVQARDNGSTLPLSELLVSGMRAELPTMIQRYSGTLEKVATGVASAEEIARDTLAAKIGERIPGFVGGLKL